ncbi:MAG: hypothetical protein ABS49_11570 [Erythrobacter sp. SCN 62-14]|nr:MAG: hypothetical protein ABS49_11570 [Erythrobacter sp. SCN 62-14]
MSAHSYTGLRGYLARQEADFGHLAPSKPTMSKKADAIARLKAQKIERDREFEASESKRATTTTPKATGAAKAAPAKVAAPAPSYADGLSKGFTTCRDIERARIKAVADVAIERGQAADALRMLATDAEAPAIIAKLRESNLLADAMLKRFGGAA